MEIKIWKTIWLLLTNGYFRILLMETILYARRNQNKVRGKGASDVLTFCKLYIGKISKATS